MHKSVALLVTLLATQSAALRAGSPDKAETARNQQKVLRVDPVDITSRDLYYGPRGKQDMPTGDATFTFEKEDLDGTNPKYVVKDDKGNKWKVKWGDEARPETAASRLVWSMGYFVDEDYFLPAIRVRGVPTDLKRGRKLFAPDGTITGVRLKLESKDHKKIDNWDWHSAPFAGTRDLNGLRVLMALINNWDLKEVNNGVFQNGTELVYEVTDLGSSFGSPRFDVGYAHDKGDLKSYQRSKFIQKIRENDVDFTVPGAPSLPVIFNPAQYFKRRSLTWIGRNIPRADAQWMGEQLSHLSAKQIDDAFRAGGYSTAEANEYTTLVQARIAQLKQL